MPRRLPTARLTLLILLMLGLAGGAAMLRFGLLPNWVRWLPAVDLGVGRPWLIDRRLAELRHDPALCRHVLKAPHIQALPITDAIQKPGCGWSNSVRISSIGGARFTLDKLTCETSAALALWVEHDVQPLAVEIFGQRVVSIQHLGSYACRNIVGNPLWRGVRSEHASANAIDISGFTLVDGRQINVLKHWRGAADEQRFLAAAHRQACRYFHVALSPAYNAAHRDHFHLDRGTFRQCT